MVRALTVLAVLSCLPGLARAQLDAPPEPALPPPPSDPAVQPPTEPPTPAPAPPAAAPAAAPAAPPRYETTVVARQPSPVWTQDRTFSTTRMWVKDPGTFEAELWWRTRIPHSINGARGPAAFRFQAEIEMGLAPHLQLDLYETATCDQGDDGARHFLHAGNAIELRVAIPSYYGEIWGNPVLYFEWMPNHGEPDRAEFRLLLGGAATSWLYLAANPYVETNVEATVTSEAVMEAGAPVVRTGSKFIADAEIGTTLAAGFRITDWLSLSAETKIGVDMLGDEHNHFHFVWWLGPGFIVKPLGNDYFKIMGTCLFAIPPTDTDAQQFEPVLIIGSGF